MVVDLYARFGKKRYALTDRYINTMKAYMRNKPSKDFLIRWESFISGSMNESEIQLYLSSLITHSILAYKLMNISDTLEVRPVIRVLDDYLSGDVSAVEDFRKELSNNM